MTIEQIVSPTVPVLSPTDTGSKALSIMTDNNVSELPLVDDDNYVALISEDDILESEDQDAPLSQGHFLDYKPAIQAGSHPYDAIKLSHQQNLAVIPVVDADNRYLGAVTTESLLNYVAETSGYEIPGAVIVVEVEPREYNLCGIARVFENEDAIIISTQLYSNRQTNKVEVTIKCNRTEVSGIIASLEHNNYKIIEVFGNSSNPEDVIDRYNLLMNYLNM